MIFYCIYLKLTGCFEIKKTRTNQYFSHMWFVFISCSWHLKVKLTAVLRPVQTPFVRNKNKNLWPHVTVRSRLSVCIDCTVLLHPASTVMIKRWLSTSVTSLSLLLFHLLAFAGLQSRNNFLLKVCIDLSCDGKDTEPPRGGERGCERGRGAKVVRLRGMESEKRWGDLILGFWFYLFVLF